MFLHASHFELVWLHYGAQCVLLWSECARERFFGGAESRQGNDNK